MLVVIGTVPDDKFPVVSGPVGLSGKVISVDGREVPVNRGTPALLAATCLACESLELPPPVSFLVGDEGIGNGSRKLYEYLTSTLPATEADLIVFHYLQPDVDWHNRILLALEEKEKRPLLIADAGYMYAAKMSGFAPCYDLFTPDIGELAFLADDLAPHPFYTRGFILHEEDRVLSLVEKAYKGDNAAKTLLIKGSRDFICNRDEVLDAIDTPSVAILEPIGGTGDTLTGLTAALIWRGFPVAEAAMLGAKANRLAGQLANPTPATQVFEVVKRLPEALESIFGDLYKTDASPWSRRDLIAKVASSAH